MQVLVGVAVRVASNSSPGQTAVGEWQFAKLPPPAKRRALGRQSESSKLRGERGGLAALG